jgi:hypothetical protein
VAAGAGGLTMTSLDSGNKSGRERLGGVRTMVTFFRYNVANVFSGRAIIFAVLAVVVFLAVIVLNLLNREAALSGRNIYDFLLIPGVLFVFYPAFFAIQNDVDAGMIETLFGIPDHRYKVWLVRYFTLYGMTAVLVFILAVFCRVGLAAFSLGSMVGQVMVPVVFIGSLAFFIAGRTGSGVGTAVIMIVILLIFWLLRYELSGAPWYLFHNPFGGSSQAQIAVLAKTTIANRLFLLSGSLVLTLLALLRLQKREKFI